MSGFNITPNPALLRGATPALPGSPTGSIAGLQGARLPGPAGGTGPFGGGMGLTATPAPQSGTQGINPSSVTAGAAQADYQKAQAGLAENMAQQRATGNAGSASNLGMMPSNPAFYGR